MYLRVCGHGYLRDEFIEGVKGFLDFVYTQPEYCSDDEIRCPCEICDNKKYFDRDTVNVHLLKKDFTLGYSKWFAHGELIASNPAVSASQGESPSNIGAGDGFSEPNKEPYRTMVKEAMGQPNEAGTSSFSENDCTEEPNQDAAEFYALLKEADVPLWDKCEKESRLSAVSKLLNCKSECGMSATCYDRIMKIIKDMLPEGEILPPDFYQ